jgi:hypothetical protein
MKKAWHFISFLVFLLIACWLAISSFRSGQAQIIPITGPSAPGSEIAAGPATPSSSLWISPSVPPALHQQAGEWGIPMADGPASATLQLDVRPHGMPGAVWIYALVAPFPTVTDGVSFQELLANWHGSPGGTFAGRPLLMDESTLAAFTALWGSPASGSVQSVPADQLLDTSWSERPSWAIVPFESLDPRWKVLAIDDRSPIRKDFQASRQILQTSFDYPLTITFGLRCLNPCSVSTLPVLPSTNRDPSKMTTVIMTGVTALVRATAYTMNGKGVLYPGRDVRDWFIQADITHISNEIPFFDKCPPPDPNQSKLVFCSDPRYIELLNYVGTDVVELTGNHFSDFGPEAMQQTLALYRQNQIPYYGGGTDLEEARKPLLLENNGNKIAFIGCNSVDIDNLATASVGHPGAAPCDYDYMTREIRQLHYQGYLVISTFQYYETYATRPFGIQIRDFRLMADAGATIVQGSQAHLPQSMEFHQGAFIHYGLGNLFFDQMNPGTRREFIDRHVFYDGRYISTELLTASLTDYSQPRPMTLRERAAFLAEYFTASGW